MGAAYAAGVSIGLYHPEHIYDHIRHTVFEPEMKEEERKLKYSGWKTAVERTLLKK